MSELSWGARLVWRWVRRLVAVTVTRLVVVAVTADVVAGGTDRRAMAERARGC